MANEWRPDPSRYGGGTYKPPRQMSSWGWAAGAAIAVVAIAVVVFGFLSGCGEATSPGPSPVNEALPPDATATAPTLKVIVHDDTRHNSPAVEVWARGSGSYYPALEFGSDARELTIEGGQLFVYPDGRDGREIVVPIKPPPDLIEGSTRDAVNVVVADREVEVYGTPVPGFERSSSRSR